MPYYYYNQPDRIATLKEALNSQTVDQLKELVALIGGKAPTRKAELVEYVQQGMQIENLKKWWERCDRLQKAVISEVVHSPSDRYQQMRFISKYGQSGLPTRTSPQFWVCFSMGSRCPKI
jgi:hypothetical protein